MLVVVEGVGILSRLTGVGGALSDRGREIPERQIKQVEKQENHRIKTNDTSEITIGLIFSHKAPANMPNFYLIAGQYLSRSISALKYEKMQNERGFSDIATSDNQTSDASWILPFQHHQQGLTIQL